ncbi:hypothetical protein GCM10023320_00290 [Pseudonocardia adelaidensis]|uniref:Uncharacterized protein n=1 Tax=Pseudonocardia adelaidensis TaxID=648754 RepID=A0ABP9N6S8_9PSEU
MDLTALLLRVAARRPHVLVVAVPGAAGARLALEAALAHRGWPVATGPADADVLAVAGAPGPDLAAVVDAVWGQVPAPCVRIDVPAPADVGERLDAAAALLADAEHQRTEVVDGNEGHGDHEEHHDHDGHHDHAEHGGGGHDGHHHGHGGTVAGLPMAEVGPDRDGLTLDRLHVPLGPVLPDWPAGLVVRVTLQGDVIQEASAEVLDAGPAEPFEWPSVAARELDGLARFLGVAGWPRAAGRARTLRDALLAGGEVGAEVTALVRRIRRSRTLRWLVRDISVGSTDLAALLAERLAAVEDALPERQRGGHAGVARQYGHHAGAGMAELLVGAELAAARLIVAALDRETDRMGAGHG